MTPFELVCLSMASKRTRNIIMHFFAGKSKYAFSMSVAKDYGVCLQNGWNHWQYYINEKESEKKEINTLGLPPQFYTEEVFKISKNPMEEFFELCEYIQNLFICKIEGLHFEMDKFPLQNQSIIDFLKTRQDIFEYFEIYSKTGSDRDLKYLLENLKTDKFLTIESEIGDDFEVELPENLEDLCIRKARFVKFEQLLRLKSRRISLNNTSLTPIEMNAFLRSWMAAESHSNLEFFMIGINIETANEILADIPHEIEDVMEVRTFEYENVRTHVRGGVTIKRIDGKSARIVPHVHLNSIYMRMYIY